MSDDIQDGEPPPAVTAAAPKPRSAQARQALEQFMGAFVRDTAIAANPIIYNPVHAAYRAIIDALPQLDKEA